MHINLNIHVKDQITVFVLFLQQYGLHSLFCTTLELSKDHLFFEIGQKWPWVKIGPDQKRSQDEIHLRAIFLESKLTSCQEWPKLKNGPGQNWSQLKIRLGPGLN